MEDADNKDGIDDAEAPVIDDLLRAGFAWLLFPPALEARFQADTFERTRHYAFICMLIGTFAFDLQGISDILIVPDMWDITAILRLGVLTPLALISAIANVWLIPPRYRRQTTLISSTILYVLFACGPILLQVLTRSDHAQFYLAGMPVVIMFFALVIRLDFWVVATATVALLGASCSAIGLAPVIAAPVKLNMGMLLLGTVVLSLFAAYDLERRTRLNYLIGRRQAISDRREKQLIATLDQANASLRALAMTDTLTGIANRRHFDEYLSRLWEGSAQTDSTISLLLMDVDYFKQYNDHYGHVAGDATLQAVSRIISLQGRGRQDLLARYGGEEFVMILPSCDLFDAEKVGRRICAAVEEFALPHAAREDGFDVVTISVGVACAKRSASSNEAALLAAADAALYRAKEQGRNNVVVQSGAEQES